MTQPLLREISNLSLITTEQLVIHNYGVDGAGGSSRLCSRPSRSDAVRTVDDRTRRRRRNKFRWEFCFFFFAQHRKVLWLSMSLLAVWDSSAFVLSTVWLVRARAGMTNSWDHRRRRRRRCGKGEKLASSQFQCCRYFVEGACLGGFSLIYLHVDNGR